MKTQLPFAAIVLFGALVPGCGTGPRSPVGFRLPEGDIEKGRAAFLQLECHVCHQVAGVEFPEPVIEPPVPVILGGTVFEVRTDGYLVTSIINPSHRLARGPRRADLTTPEGDSRMPDLTELMRVDQLIDLVAFLQSRYKVVMPPQPML